MAYRFILSFLLLVFVAGCTSHYKPPVTTPVEMSQRDKLNLSLGLTGAFVQSCAKDVKRLAPNRTALFHYLSHAEELTTIDPSLRVVVFDVPNQYDRVIKIVASRDDLVLLYNIFKDKEITDIYSSLSAPYDEDTVEDALRYEVIFKNALRLMDRVPLQCKIGSF